MAAAALLSATDLVHPSVPAAESILSPYAGRKGRRVARLKPAKNYHRDVGRTKCWPRAQTETVVSWGPSWLRPPLPKGARPRR